MRTPRHVFAFFIILKTATSLYFSEYYQLLAKKYLIDIIGCHFAQNKEQNIYIVNDYTKIQCYLLISSTFINYV